MKDIRNDPSPCLNCRRVGNPDKCENKRCNYWRNWFLRRWELIHRYPCGSDRNLYARSCRAGQEVRQ